MENQNKQTNKIKFFNGLTTCKPIKYEKVHNEFIDQYEELPPYAKNETTGEILNPTNKYVYRKIKPKNIHEYIQSQTKEADIVEKIKNMTPAEKEASKNGGIFIDTTKIGNIHQEHEKTKVLETELAKAEEALAIQREKEHNAKVIAEYEKQKQIEAEKKKQEGAK